MKNKLFLLITLLAIYGCNKSEIPPKHNIQGIWVCVIEHFDITITLTIDNTTVGVSKSPKEMGVNDGYHQFRDGDQYFLQNNTLYLTELEGNVCFKPDCTFAITILSENEMELKYMGGLFAYPLYIDNYLFNRKIVE